ncbi:MAG TPA: hypothetical protein VFR47_12890 [Anaerolineales bacterium]|nr:hypothetical protein [Anaerolineales bacterium]
MSVDTNLATVSMVQVFQLNISPCSRSIDAKAGVDPYIGRPFEPGINKAE